MPISEWLDLMPASVTYRSVTGRNAYGKPTHASPGVVYRARVVYHSRRVVSRVTGQDTVASCEVWINGIITTLNVDDLFVLPDGSTPPIISWDLPTDETGNHHVKIYFSGTGGSE